eukprot:GABV01009816.1.p2 GENE.GABV01009816.1~~GABV01009816.1.p2  ORF type:complete len:137 (-),score=56.83 GABV01009816.1:39-449(-)
MRRAKNTFQKSMAVIREELNGFVQKSEQRHQVQDLTPLEHAAVLRRQATDEEESSSVVETKQAMGEGVDLDVLENLLKETGPSGTTEADVDEDDEDDFLNQLLAGDDDGDDLGVETGQIEQDAYLLPDSVAELLKD